MAAEEMSQMRNVPYHETIGSLMYTAGSIQGQKLVTTKFKHGNLVLGISEVMWR